MACSFVNFARASIFASSTSFDSLLEAARSFIAATEDTPAPPDLPLLPLRLRLLLEELLEELLLLLERLLWRPFERLLERLFAWPFDFFFFFFFAGLLLFELLDERRDEELLEDGLRLFEEPSSGAALLLGFSPPPL
mmetsp:Transcript_117427/g.312334  ORF Transcript_117427/g.312334 Transcript_117427/m.312334 type:complete len:137 (-) Transcript_117427:633-1043(-)